MNSELEKAARYLERTASDYDQMAAQLNQQKSLTQNQRMELYYFQRTAELLRGQANHVRGLK